jgi:hypothetical protein
MENTEPSTTSNTTESTPSEVSGPIQPGKMVHLIPKNCIKNSALHVHVSKEPKYVPYEPYKAAVNPRMPCLKQKKTKINVKKKAKEDDSGISIHQAVPVTQATDFSKDVATDNQDSVEDDMKHLNISDCPVSFTMLKLFKIPTVTYTRHRDN